MNRIPPIDDSSVAYLPDAEIDKIAAHWRKALNDFFMTTSLDVNGLLRAFNQRRQAKVDIQIRPDNAMGRANAFVSGDRKSLFLRESLTTRASAGDPQAIFDVVHELGHLVLHPNRGPELPRMIDGNIRSRGLDKNSSAEYQANRFARAFLMLPEEIEQFDDVDPLAENCNVPVKQAELRLTEFRLVAQPLPRAARFAWEHARFSSDFAFNDPSRYRLSRGGLLVDVAGYNKPDHKFGWFEDCGNIVSYQEVRLS